MTTQSARIDYFRATTTYTGLIKDAQDGYFNDHDTEQSVPLYGYKHALRHIRDGSLYLFGGHTPSMGNCMQFGGSAITSLMDAVKLASVPSLRVIGSDGWKVTRVDVAIDCYNPDLRPRHVYAALDYREKKSIWRTWREVAQKDLDAGHTVYGGGVESDKRIRIYDKAAESGTEGVWTRYEMVFSDERAAEVWKHVADCRTDAQLLVLARALLASMLDFPKWKEWQDEFSHFGKVEWSETPRVESDKWRWLMEQVAPTFRDARAREGNWSMLDRFVAECKRSDE